MILLEVKCPRCDKIQKYLSYAVKKREDVMGRQKMCVVCGKQFVILGSGYPKVDRIVKELRFKP